MKCWGFFILFPRFYGSVVTSSSFAFSSKLKLDKRGKIHKDDASKRNKIFEFFILNNGCIDLKHWPFFYTNRKKNSGAFIWL